MTKTKHQPPEREFDHSVWVVDWSHTENSYTDSSTYLFDIDNYEGAMEKYQALVDDDKENGMYADMRDNIEDDPDLEDYWEVEINYDPPSYYIDVGESTLYIRLYEQQVHRKQETA